MKTINREIIRKCRTCIIIFSSYTFDTNKLLVFLINLIVYSNVSLYSQVNLIPNSDFFEVVDCPDGPNMLELAEPWNCATAFCSSELLHICATDPDFSVPNSTGALNLEGINKDAYAGITVAGRSVREYLQTPLKLKLSRGQIYFIQFWVSPGVIEVPDPFSDSTRRIETYSDEIGLIFQDTMLSYPLFERIPINPCIENNQGLISESSVWNRICGIYEGKGWESYATIGNFKTDEETTQITVPENVDVVSYMLIDEVGVYPFDPLPDTISICEDSSILLDATFLDATYKWSTGDTLPTISVKNEGTYTVEISLGDCFLYDSIEVISEPINLISSQADTTICSGNPITLSASSTGIYLWNLGDTTRNILVRDEGLYQVRIQNECDIKQESFQVDIKECSCSSFIPNVFSPNADSINDLFQGELICDFPIVSAELMIYNRWGNKLHHQNSSIFTELRWNGYYKGEPTPEGIYYWQMTYSYMRQNEVVQVHEKGTLTLIR